MTDDVTAKAQRLALAHGATPDDLLPDPEPEPVLCIHELDPATCSICKHGPSLGPVVPCRSCQADIVWCRTENRRNMPVDAQPNATGNLVRIGTEDGKAVMSAKPPQVVRVLVDTGQPLYTSHFATCDDPDGWRRR